MTTYWILSSIWMVLKRNFLYLFCGSSYFMAVAFFLGVLAFFFQSIGCFFGCWLLWGLGHLWLSCFLCCRLLNCFLCHRLLCRRLLCILWRLSLLGFSCLRLGCLLRWLPLPDLAKMEWSRSSCFLWLPQRTALDARFECQFQMNVHRLFVPDLEVSTDVLENGQFWWTTSLFQASDGFLDHLTARCAADFLTLGAAFFLAWAGAAAVSAIVVTF